MTAIALKIPGKEVVSKKSFILSESLYAALETYTKAAQEDNPSATMDDVVAAIIATTIKKDRAFKNWLKQKKAVSHEKLPSAEEAKISSNGDNTEEIDKE